MLRDLVLKTRSYRRFRQDVGVPTATLHELIDLARCSASAANLQPLKYAIANDPATNARIFRHLRWAAYLKEWTGPAEGERPSAYIIVLGDMHISQAIGPDHGIAAQSILLGATEIGLGGCMIASLNREALREEFSLPEWLEILIVIALGKPAETVALETVGPGGDIRYWRDEKGVHHVPKRRLEDILIQL